ncbi:MAG: putative amidoligase domain-containing protein [Candidatus Helarchaeales archaeon]
MKRKEKRSITIGGDPEFGAVERVFNRAVPAHLFVRDSRIIGLDGHRHVLEIRPKEATNPQGFVKNIKKAFQKFTKEFPSFYLTAGSFTKRERTNKGTHEDPIGGHVHLGFRNVNEQFEDETKRELYRLAESRLHCEMYTSNEYHDSFEYTPSRCIVAILCLQPLSMILLVVEGKEGIRRRNNRTHTSYGPYGCPTNFRTPSYGIEYRCPSSNHQSPRIALSHYAIPYRIVDFMVNGDPEEVKEYFKRCIRLYLDVIEPCIKMGNYHPFRVERDKCVERFKDDFKDFPPFKRLRGDERTLLNLFLRDRVLPQKPSNIFKHWGIKLPEIDEASEIIRGVFEVRNKKIRRIKRCAASYFY